VKKASHKNARRNNEVMRALAEIIRGDIKDPRINSLTTVTGVEVSPDLKTCKAWISVYGDEKSQADTLAGLKSAEGFIKSQLARTINMRNTPEINFILDESIAYGAKMSQIIDEMKK
jgi:ribosome-binding factor A